MHSLFSLALVVTNVLIDISDSTCGYVDLSATLADQNVGKFHLSTNKCQVIDATINILKEVKLNESLILTCDPLDSNTIIMRAYPNQLCLGNPDTTSSVPLGESASLFYMVYYLK